VGIVSQVHLRLDLYGVTKHAQEVMKDLGIRYQIAVPQSLYDCWWFFNCVGIPDVLPEYLEVLAIDPVDCVGRGLSQEDVDSLKHGKALPTGGELPKPPSGGENFKRGQIVPKRLRMAFCSDPKGQHSITFGSDVRIIGRHMYAKPKDGECAIFISDKGRRMNNGTYKKLNWVFRDMHLVVL
jgi:hypothetical protein